MGEENVLGERYVKTEVIGTGANGIVYKAFDRHLKRYVAIKKVKRNEEWAWKEAEVLKQLKHLSIPVIYDVIKDEEGISIVMEHMEGTNLLSVLENEEMLEEKRVVEIAIQIGECMRYLHHFSNKIIYRDLKPANVIIDEKNKIKLIDFDSAFAKISMQDEKTQTGTYGYCAPEQFETDGMVDEKSDIYGLGTTMYHMLTGKNPSRPPYQLYKIREMNPFVSEKLEAIVEKCMEKEREKRYETMDEVLEELENYNKNVERRKISKQITKHTKKYMIEETKNIFLSCKKSGGLFVIIVLLCGVWFWGDKNIIKNHFRFLPETVYAKDFAEEKEILPLILYNRKKEKIIIQDGKFYETDGDFHMALPFSVFESKKGVEITVVCKDLENEKSMEKVVLIKAK